MQELKWKLKKLEEEHEAERERLYLLHTGKTAKSKPRNISTAKLREMSTARQSYKSLITLPHIFTLYAQNYHQRCLSSMSTRSLTSLHS